MPNAPVFVDSNIVLYARESDTGLKQRIAAQWLERLWSEERGRISVQVLSEFYWNATRKRGVDPGAAWATVDFLMGWKPLPLDVELVRQARVMEATYHLNWWDAQIVAAARMQGCATLLSEDMQHGALLGSVRIQNPFLTEVHEEPARYTVQLPSRHRPRGRPRKQALPA